MHELSLVGSIVDVVLKHAALNKVEKVVGVELRIGELTDLADEWMQHYFNYLSKDTAADGATLKIERVPVVFRCANCGEEFSVKMRETKEITCPACGGNKASLISGREFTVKNIEVACQKKGLWRKAADRVTKQSR